MEDQQINNNRRDTRHGKMNATSISFSIQKGGAGKTTATAISAFLLAEEGKRVLTIDFDSQGNLTEFLTRNDIGEFRDRTILQAMKEQHPAPYIIPINDNLHLIPAEDLLATFSRWLYRDYKGDPKYVLQKTLSKVRRLYDYILIDTPPSLGDQTINALCASDYCVAMLQTEPFCYSAMERFLETLTVIKEGANPDLQLAGILIAMSDGRTGIDKAIAEKAREEYEDIVFEAEIRRRSRIKEYVLDGIQDNTKIDREVLEPYKSFVKELQKRCQNKAGQIL